MQVQVKDFADTEMLSPYEGRARIPDHRDKIFKDECLFSFDSPVCIDLNVIFHIPLEIISDKSQVSNIISKPSSIGM